MHLLAVTAPQVSATSAVITAVVAVVTGAVAIATFVGVRRDSRDRSRPLMVVELGPRPLGHGVIELLVSNAGQSAARDLKVTFDPPLDGPDEEGHNRTMLSFIRARYEHMIPAVAPGARLSNTYGMFRGDGTNNLREQAPLDLTIALRYLDDRGREYSDMYPVSVGAILNETLATPGNTDDKGLRKRWAEALETIAGGVGRP